MSSPWLMSGTTSLTPAARSALTAGESSWSSSIATAPDPAWKYARIGSFGAMSIGGVSRARPRAVMVLVVGAGAAHDPPERPSERQHQESVLLTGRPRSVTKPEADVGGAHRRADRCGEL